MQKVFTKNVFDLKKKKKKKKKKKVEVPMVVVSNKRVSYFTVTTSTDSTLLELWQKKFLGFENAVFVCNHRLLIEPEKVPLKNIGCNEEMPLIVFNHHPHHHHYDGSSNEDTNINEDGDIQTNINTNTNTNANVNTSVEEVNSNHQFTQQILSSQKMDALQVQANTGYAIE
ncbi:hypothetical protein RFI_14248, partial [Reticulomyxa filosa]